jgi:hypothetical protein
MVNYKCPRCGYQNNIKTKYVNHLRRKKLCNNTVSNNNLYDEYIKYNISEKINVSSNITVNHPKTTQNIPKSSQNIPKHPKTSQNILKSNKIYQCKYCYKKYKHNYHLTRHHKKCKNKEDVESDIQFKKDMLELVNRLNNQLTEQKDQLTEQKDKFSKQQEEFKKVLEKRDQQIDVLIKKTGMNINNSTITQNIQQNIKLLAYKNTDISHLTDKDYLKCINHSNFCVPHLIRKIHFDPEKPENHNVYISNIKNRYIMIYDGKKWNLQNQDETIDDLIDTNEFVLEQKLEEWVENGKDYPEIMRKFNRYLERKEKDEILNKIKNEIKLMLFNNRKMISI